MKALSLYIEKWYIVGAIVNDSGFLPLSLPNTEERVWLYFYNDLEANRVRYSQTYKGETMANAMNYYGNVFSLIPSSKEKSYKWYGSDTHMRTIFGNAGIFEDLRGGFDRNEKIPTYLAFSSDICLESQSIFLDLLRENNFDVKEFVAHIEYLGVEYAQRKGLITNSNYILVANACNENLHYALYHQENGLSVQVGNSKVLRGKGEDSRRYAIVEQVIDIINAGSRLLSHDEEKAHEHQFLSQYAEKWLSMIDDNEANTATPLGNVCFSKQIGNAYPVSVLKSDIDKRTAATVDEIVNEMAKILSGCNVESYEISHVLLLGDVFDNREFKNNLQKRFAIESANFVHIHEQELANVVNIYCELPNNIFDEDVISFKKNVEEEIHKAEKEQQEKIDTLTRFADDAEHRGEYEKALESFKEAIELSPSNNYLKEKIRNLENLIKDNQVKSKSYNRHIAKAKTALDIKNWEEAFVQSELALKVKPNSEEAIKLSKRIKEMKKQYAQLDEYIVKIKTLIEHEDYEAASKEIDNVSSLGLKDPRLLDFSNIIKQAKNRLQEQIRKEAGVLDSCLELRKYEEAISHANELLKIDKEHTSIWNDKISAINQERAKEKERLARIASLGKQIESAQANENWEKVALICDQYLSIEENADIRELKDLSGFRLVIQQQQAIFDEAFLEENWQKVIELDREYPSLHQNSENVRKIKNARRLLSLERKKKSNHTIEIPIGGGEIVPDTSGVTPSKGRKRSAKPKPTSPKHDKKAESETTQRQNSPAKKKYPIPRRSQDIIDEGCEESKEEEVPINEASSNRKKFPRPKRMK